MIHLASQIKSRDITRINIDGEINGGRTEPHDVGGTELRQGWRTTSREITWHLPQAETLAARTSIDVPLGTSCCSLVSYFASFKNTAEVPCTSSMENHGTGLASKCTTCGFQWNKTKQKTVFGNLVVITCQTCRQRRRRLAGNVTIASTEAM